MKKIVLLTATLLTVVGASAQESVDTLKAQKLKEVVVKAVRAPENAPFAVANIKKSDLQNFSKTGLELPYLLARIPGILAWGENGLGTGTAYMRVRGAAGSRINVTLDGVALNSPEDQTVFWANMNSYAALLGSVQIQRGIGTSTNGDGAFGGTISLATTEPNPTPTLELTRSNRRYNTYNAGASFSTGLLKNHWVFNGAYHETSTDGYVHGTEGRSGSYLGALTYYGDKFSISYKNVGNFEKTGQAWSGVTAGNDNVSLMNYGVRTYNDMYKMGLGKFNSLYEGMDIDDNGNVTTHRYQLRDGSYWKKTTDNFYQDHNILSGVWKPSKHWTHNIALHYTYGYGYYSEFRPNYKLSKFGLTYYDADGNQVKRTDFIRKKGLSQHTYGLVYNVNYKDEKWDVIGGVNLQQFRGNHFGYLTYIANEAVEAKFRPNGQNYMYYNSDAHKDDYSTFLKATHHLNDYFDAFADVQFRYVRYKTTGYNDKFYKKEDGTYSNQMLTINKNYFFVNPKAGLSFHKDGHKAYASIAYANREPERNNFTDNGNYPAPSPERLMDIELGYQYTGNNWHAGASLYYMDYTGQFVQTGMQSDIGENLTTNIDDSYRLGAEITADWSPLSWFTIAGNAALSKNKIKDFTEYAEDWYSKSGYRKIHYDNSDLSFSPSAILNGFLDFHYKGFQGLWHTNYVSRQYLDNTKNEDRSLPWFTQTNISLNYTLNVNRKFIGMKEAVFGVNFNNIFDRHYANSGWVYSAYDKENMKDSDARYYQIGFIPAAGFTVMGNVTLRF